ncbi:Mitogen-activated protein kinase kinase kinase 5 [Araneus ventricosus]|uniref:Mitogen-activated protein kinase kinase kinase 5 n=1 Tax=Araneus ventricosus TaxID=182803 RepID=A0A4Y2DLA4_ARAVE|nr:Mitogen-activated protein kinase kinase kinase 5 [Araneus ventricosus]
MTSFQERCFVPDPDERATASDLLEEPFILEPSRKKKPPRDKKPAPDFNRSISVPERVSKLDKPGKVERFASTGEEGSSVLSRRSPSNSLKIPSPNFSFSTESSENRRSSTGLLSPPIDSPQIDQEQGNFYLLKKDSQRRATICKVLLDNADTICENWMNDLSQKTPDIVLTMDHLKVLLEGLREYIPEQNKLYVQQAISSLKEEVEFDGIAVNQMHLALYVFQDAVKSVLRKQNIMPHWVFALDSLVRSSVQAAISILSPAVQEDNESIEQYICCLRKLASTCNYQNTPEELIRDRLVLGIQDRNAKKQPISDSKLTLQKAIVICKSNESANQQRMNLKCKNETFEDINKMKGAYKKNTKFMKKQKPLKYQGKCKYCCGKHEFDRNKCPAFNKVSRNCEKMNHWAKACKSVSKSVKELHEDSTDTDQSNSAKEYIYKVNQSKKLLTKLTFQVNDYQEEVACQMDTGASVYIMRFKNICNIFQDPNLSLKDNIKLKCFGGDVLKPIGQITLNCLKDSKCFPVTFQIANTNDNPLLSAKACQELNLIEIKAGVLKISSPLKDDAILKKYKKVFEGTGCIKGDYHLETKSNVQPIKQAPRRIPISLKPELK